MTVALLGIGAGAVSAARTPEVRIVVERYSNGHVRRESTFRGEVLDGPSRGWYESGAPMFAYAYRAGLSEGVQRQWYPTGQALTRFHYSAGHEQGQQQMWNADGTIRSNYVIKGGRRFGLIGSMGCTGKGKPVSGDIQ